MAGQFLVGAGFAGCAAEAPPPADPAPIEAPATAGPGAAEILHWGPRSDRPDTVSVDVDFVNGARYRGGFVTPEYNPSEALQVFVWLEPAGGGPVLAQYQLWRSGSAEAAATWRAELAWPVWTVLVTQIPWQFSRKHGKNGRGCEKSDLSQCDSITCRITPVQSTHF